MYGHIEMHKDHSGLGFRGLGFEALGLGSGAFEYSAVEGSGFRSRDLLCTRRSARGI